MEHSVLSYSLVCLWAKPVQKIPILDKKFCLDLFDDPYNTEHGLSDDGFVVVLNEGKNPTPLFKINPLRIQFLHRSLDELINTTGKVVSQLIELTSSEFQFNIRALGINTEHEWTGLDKNAEDYLAEEYLNAKINKQDSDNLFIKTKTLDFQIISNDNGRFGVKLEPRANNKKSIFCKINDHRVTDLNEFPNENEIRSLFDDSLDKLEKHIFNRII